MMLILPTDELSQSTQGFISMPCLIAPIRIASTEYISAVTKEKMNRVLASNAKGKLGWYSPITTTTLISPLLIPSDDM